MKGGADLGRLSLGQLARAIRSGEITSETVTVQMVDRMASLGKDLNCVVRIDAEAALQQARLCDREAASGRWRGPLHGVPIAHKDVFYRQGQFAASGTIVRRDFLPDCTATVLEKLDDAGAIDLGRLQMVELALGPTGYNEFFGTPINPSYPDHIPGGSSSGSAVAVAAGLTPVSLGTDSGGSLRTPAACCGIIGFKPSYGLVSRYGVMPLSHSLDHVGILARRVDDCAIIFDIIAGYDARDPGSADALETSQSIKFSSGELRIAIPGAPDLQNLDRDVRERFEEAVTAVAHCGFEIVEVELPGFTEANACTNIIMAVEAATVYSADLQAHPEKFGRETLERLLPGMIYPATRYLDALGLRKSLTRRFHEDVYSKADCLLLPVLQVLVPKVSQLNPNANEPIDYVNFAHFTRPINLFGFPSLSMPGGTTSGNLPFGIQLVAPPYHDHTLLRLGKFIEEKLGNNI